MDSDNRTSEDSLPGAAVTALQAGNKIAAIKILRERSSVGLKQAKAAVDEYVAGHPELRETIATAQAKAVRKALLPLAVIVVLAVFFVWLYLR